MFGKKGYAATDVQILADQLGIGKGTVYRYFPTKRELFLAAVDRGMRQMHACVEDARLKGGDPLDQIARAVRAYLAFFDVHPELVELFILERAVFKDRKKPTYFQHRDANMGPWVELFRELIAAGRVRDMPIARITGVVNDLLYGTMFTNYFVGRRKSFQTEAREILDVVFNGILTESERQRRNASGGGVLQSGSADATDQDVWQARDRTRELQPDRGGRNRRGPNEAPLRPTGRLG